MRKRDQKIIRVGDVVEVIKPQVFIRCGYPLCLMDIAETLDRYDEDIYEFLNKIMDKENPTNKGGKFAVELSLFAERIEHIAAYKVRHAIAYQILKEKGFGGNERSIFTEEKPFIVHRKYVVDSIKYVKTGTYTPARYKHSSYYYDDGDNYEPAYLTDEKTHKILTLKTSFLFTLMYIPKFQIEATNVEKVMK